MTKLMNHAWRVALVGAWLRARGRKEFLKEWFWMLSRCEWRCTGPKYVYRPPAPTI